MKLSVKIFLGFALVLIFSGIDSFVNYRLSSRTNKNSEFLTRSEELIRNSTRLHKAMIGMQSGFRGYLLSGNESFLQAYYSGLNEIPPIMADQRMLFLNESQELKLDSIKDLHQQWVDYSSRIIAAKRDTSPEGEREYAALLQSQLSGGVGKKINDDISDLFKSIDRKEYKIRQIRGDILLESIERTNLISLMLGILTISVGLAAAIYITSIITKRISHMVGLAERISNGNFKILIEDDKNDELTGLSHSLNSMSKNLDKSFTELDQFAYVVSHDLKAPLRGLDNIIKWIEEDLSHTLTPELKKYFVLMQGRIVRLENLINGLLEYARIGRVKKELEIVNTRQLLNEICEVIVPSNFIVTINCDVPLFLTEKLRLEQVFSNLISNAVKYNDKPKGEIVIKCQELENHYEFSVVDNGPGINMRYHEKIFMIFQTLKEKDAFESTGVGLAIVKKIINDVNGTIKLFSEPGNGSTFVFTWPKEITTQPIIKQTA